MASAVWGPRTQPCALRGTGFVVAPDAALYVDERRAPPAPVPPAPPAAWPVGGARQAGAVWGNWRERMYVRLLRGQG